MKRSLVIAVSILVVLATASVATATTVADFDDASLALQPETYWNGSDGSGGFTSQGLAFNNSYTDWGGGMYSWGGFAYSNTSDTTTAGYLNQYSAYTGTGYGSGADNYGIGYYDTYTPTVPTIELPEGAVVLNAYITNTTYAALAMLDGCSPARPFGWLDANGDNDYEDEGDFAGNYPDWFLLTITGKNATDTIGTVDFYLGDYRSENGGDDYIVDEWTEVDLSSLAGASSLEFTLSSSDNTYGYMNTPAYFAIDSIGFVPEPGSLVLLTLAFGWAMSLRRRK